MTIYVGGGTPTSLDDDLFLELLEIIKPYSTKVEEYTFEANPESLSETKIKMMKDYGVNRISIGVESTDDNILKLINRHHRFADVCRAVNLLNKYGIDNYNLDLILGLPHSSREILKKDLNNLLSLSPKHLSTYSLTVNPHTVFYLNKIEEMNPDIYRDLYDIVHDTLLEKGFIHYEISNFALPNYQSKHNQVYWKNEQYYGVGYAASGYIGEVRYKNNSNFTSYLSGNYQGEEEIVTLKDLEEYEIMLNLRTSSGLDLKRFQKIFNKDLYARKKDIIDEFIDQKYLILEDDKLIPTYDGMMILDTIILKLL